MQTQLSMRSCIQYMCTILKISMKMALVKTWIPRFLQHRWMEFFLCWAHYNKYVSHSSSLPSLIWSSVFTFNSFFIPQSELFSIGCSLSWTLVSLHGIQPISPTTHGMHFSNWALWVYTYSGRNDYNSQKRRYILHSDSLPLAHQLFLQKLCFPVPRIKPQASTSVNAKNS